ERHSPDGVSGFRFRPFPPTRQSWIDRPKFFLIPCGALTFALSDRCPSMLPFRPAAPRRILQGRREVQSRARRDRRIREDKHFHERMRIEWRPGALEAKQQKLE